MRINQFIASASGISRRAADTAIIGGRVTLNTHTAVLGQVVAVSDTVTLDGSTLTHGQDQIYLKLHKPPGYVCSRVNQSDKPTVYELLPQKWRTLRMAGRLDQASSGLLILSSDGNFLQTLSHPAAGKTKQYELTLESPLSPASLMQLKTGVILTDGISQVTVVEHDGNFVTVTLEEGRNRQLRRTFGALGYTITKLHRTRVGELELSDLATGEYFEIDRQGRAV